MAVAVAVEVHPIESRRSRWLWVGGVVLVISLAAAWKWTGLRAWVDPERVAATFEPYRTSWLALPVTLAVFVIAELLLFPVLVLVFACGVVFGPWLGSLYALLGSLLSAIVPFLIGRRLGRERLERWGGEPVRKLEAMLERRGIVAVFVARKIPAPFTLTNLVCGASPLSMRDFVLGTLLGMGTGVILLTVLGGQVLEILRSPEPREVAAAIGLLFVPVVLAFTIQRLLNRRMEARE